MSWRDEEEHKLRVAEYNRQELLKATNEQQPSTVTLYYPEVKQETQLQLLEKQNELIANQTQALTTLAQGINAISSFIVNGGLSSLLSGYARSQGVQSILGGLAANAGRNALDARTMGQNAIEIVEQIEQVFNKYAEVQDLKAKGEERDPEIHEVVEEDPGTKYTTGNE